MFACMLMLCAQEPREGEVCGCPIGLNGNLSLSTSRNTVSQDPLERRWEVNAIRAGQHAQWLAPKTLLWQ